MIHHEFDDGIIHQLPDMSVQWEKGCHEDEVAIVIPGSLPAGEYAYQVSLEYMATPLHRVITRFPDVRVAIKGAGVVSLVRKP